MKTSELNGYPAMDYFKCAVFVTLILSVTEAAAFSERSLSSPGVRFSCNFTHDLCEWTQDSSDTLDWTRHSGLTTSYGTGPSGDHTNGQSYYIYFESSAGYPNAVARLISPPVYLAHGLPKCLIFWYNMYGQSVNNLKVYFRRHGQLGAAVWGLHGNQGHDWQQAKVDITGSSPLQVVFEASKGTGYTGDIAIDDVSETDGLCLVSFDCNFEGGLCEWKQGHGDTFDWTWHSGFTQTPSTGPSGDHTTGSGHYLYTESSQPRKRGDIARLFSPVHPPTSGQCLQFYYSMYGTSMGTLSVYVQPVGGRPVKIWSKSGDTSQKMWFLVEKDLKSTASFLIVFEGIIGGGCYSDMSIDDISKTNKPCGQTVMEPTTHTTKLKHTGPFNCDFQQDFCGWTQVIRGDQFDWTRISGQTPSLFTGPDHDHTTGSGYYIYIETTGRGTGDNSQLLSPQVPPGRSCVMFWYNMYGNSVGALNVYIQTGTSLPRNPVWARRGNQGSNWIQGQIPVNVATPYQVVFEGARGMGASSDISLDDMSITSGPCAAGTTRSTITISTTKPIATSTSVELTQTANIIRNLMGQTTTSITTEPSPHLIGGQNTNRTNIRTSTTTEPTATSTTTETTTRSMTTESLTSTTTEPTIRSTESTTRHSTSPQPTADFREAIHIQCLHHGWLAAVDMRELSPRPSKFTDIYLGTDSCTGCLQGDLLIFNKTYGQCNTHAKVVDGQMTFTNYLLYVIPNALHAIRDIRWEYNVQCSHPLYANGTFHINPKLNVTTQGSFSGQVSGSPFEVSMFKDSTFRETLQGTAAIGSPVYVQVISLSHPDVVMVLDSCGATVKASNPQNEQSYPLIEHHCSVEATTNILIVRNQLTRFKFDMFDLPNDHDGIYVTCSVHYCDQMDLSPRCNQRCQLRPNPAVIG